MSPSLKSRLGSLQQSLKRRLDILSQELGSGGATAASLNMDILRAKSTFESSEIALDELIANAKATDDLNTPELEQRRIAQEYAAIIALAEKKVDELTPKLLTNENAARASSIGQCREQELKLPTIHIEPFDGEYAKWPSFCDVFTSLVHNKTSIAGAEKLQLLKNCLRGKAAAIISYIPITNNNYEEAWQLLKTRFENKRLIVNKQLDLLFDMPKMKSRGDLEVIFNTANGVVHSLKALHQPTEHWDAFLCRMAERKLDVQTLNAWEEKQSKEIPKFKDMMEFIQEKIRIFEAEALQAVDSSAVVSSDPAVKKPANPQSPQCPACQAQHKPANCEAFRQASLPERYGLIRIGRRCINCLEPFHSAYQCQAQGCSKCNRRHHVLLHEEDRCSKTYANKKEDGKDDEKPVVATVATSHVSGSNLQQALLGTANIYMKDRNGTAVKVRALLDPGSQMTIMTEELAKRLNLPLDPTDVQISGIGRKLQNGIKGEVNAHIQNRQGDFRCKARILVMDQITSAQPAQKIVGKIEVAEGLTLADENYREPGPIEVLLGVDIYMKACRRGMRHPRNGGPGAQYTAFGWVLMGAIPKKDYSKKDREVVSANLLTRSDSEGSLSGSDSAEDLLKLVEGSGDFDKSVVYSLRNYVKGRKDN